ncbi:MAG: DNA polymerase III subunit gamma/tau [Bacteroidota bacterium]|nr:DNA polymerase III subunit gamma/tau [Bacteroidota bacterium]
MENFIVSARKYRPVTFDSVIGQDTVTATLKNAIKSNHLAQAYLFCGPRGVGKTTCARILSKTINCSQITDDTEACDKCESCEAFNTSRSFNIHELDAASNNSVDDIRNLIDQVRIPPQVGKYSIYIIDEVHMLSAQAFNSFLKTLEEPPAHAIFILATTEKHKIIPTILSRCQIFDFRRIRLEDIVQRLQYVAKNEGINAEEEALHIIAQKADGAMRDALSIFDQIVSFSGKAITYQNVIDNLNVLDYEYYFKMVESFLRDDSVQCLLMLDEILNNGFDPHHFVTGLSSHIRDLLVCKDKETIALLEAGAGFKERYLGQSSSTSADFLFHALEILSVADFQFKTSKNQRLHTELTLIKLCRLTEGEKKTEFSGYEQAKVTGKKNPVEEKQLETKSAEEKKPLIESEIPPKDEVLKAEEISSVPLSKEENQNKVGKSRPAYKPQTTSIKDALNGNVRQKNEPIIDQVHDQSQAPEVVHKNSEFSLDELHAQWLEFLNSSNINKTRLIQTIRAHKPKLEEGFKVVVSLENKDQKEDFDRYAKSDILGYLKQALKNQEITLTSVLNEVKEKSKKPYTEEEKFNHLLEKNPHLKTLKQQMGLDFE